MSKLFNWAAARIVAAFALTLPLAAMAEVQKTNPVTGETETYVNSFTGSGDPAEWNRADNWDTQAIPFISGGAYSSALVANKTVSTETSIEGWNLCVGAYDGAAITWSALTKVQGDSAMRLTVDASSSITINGWGSGNLGQNGKTLSYYVANANGVTWNADLSSGTDQGLTMNYYLAGSGSVSYKVLERATHVIKQADAELSGTSQVASKTLVSFTSTDKTFGASADIKFKNGGTVLKTVGVTSVSSSANDIANTTSSLTTSDGVGSCEIIQCTDGIVLYWVDGDPAALTPTVYKPSININFTHGGSGLTTAADVGVGEYAVPGTSWLNMAGGNGSSSTVYGVDANGVASQVAGATVTVSGTRGSYYYGNVSGSTDVRHGYIDDNGDNPSPQVVVEGIPYYSYKVLILCSSDSSNGSNPSKFGYMTVNGTYYKGDLENTATVTCDGESTNIWGAARTTAWTEGGNYLLTPAIVNADGRLTVVSHRLTGCRAGIAAIQIIEVKAEIGENDLEIPVSGATEYTVSEAKELSGTVYITGSGTLTLAGEAKISAATINVGPLVTLNVDSNRLDGTTFTGAGTVVYDGVVPPTGKGWTESPWTGTVWLKNKSDITGNDVAATSVKPNSLGNAKSKVKFSGVGGWIEAPIEYNPEIVLENAGYDYALKLINGNSPNSTETNRCTVVKKLSGSGTLCCGGTSSAVPTLKVYDASGFTGSINTVNADDATKTGLVVVFCDESMELPNSLVNLFINSGLKRTVYVASGKTVTLDAAATWTAATGFVVEGTLNANGTLVSSASAAVTGAGTVVFDGKAPSPTSDAWWKNAVWTGTVEIKNIADMIGRTSGYTGTYLDFNSYGNAGSLIKLGNITGWMDNYTCNLPVNLAGTLTINNGVSGETFTFKKLISNGGYITATDQSATFSIRIEDGSEYAGYIGLNSKRVIFGTGTAPAFVKGQIYVSSDATITVPSVNTAYWAVGNILVDGELKADNLNRFGGGTNIMTGNNGTFTLTSAGNGSEGENDTDYARIQGTGSLKYEGTGWRALSTNNFPTAMTFVNEQTGDILLSRAITYNIGSLAGSKNFQGNYDSGSRYLNIIQSKDTEWSGNVKDDNSARLAGFTIDAASTGTLTYSGTGALAVPLTINGGAVNITGTWKGNTTVASTIGGTGTLTGDLTFSDGATFKAAATALTVSGAVTLPTAEGETLTIDATALVDDEVAILSSSSITTGTDVSKVTVSGPYAVTPVAAALKLVSTRVAFNVPAITHATVTVTVGGETIGTEPGTYKVAPDAVVTVTYAAETGYAISGTTEYTIDMATTTTFDPTETTQVRLCVAYVVFQEESGQSFVDVTNYYVTVAAAIDAAKELKKTVVLVAQPESTDTYEISAGETVNVKKGEFTFNGIIFPEGPQYNNTTTEIAGVTQYKCAVYTATVQYPGQEPESVSGQLMQILGGLYTGYAPSLVGTVVTVLDGSDATVGDAMPDVFTYNSEAHTYTLKTMVALINNGYVDTYYPTLTNAFAAATAGQTIKVLADNTVAGPAIVINKNLTLDLNGKTVTRATVAGHVFEPVDSCSFTITDTSDGATGKVVAAQKIILSGDPCIFTLNAGTLESGDNPIYLYNGNGDGIVNINGGKLVCNYTGSEHAYAIVNIYGSVNVTAGEIESQCGGFEIDAVTFSGGSLMIGPGSEKQVFHRGSYSSTITVTGGTFNRDINEYCASGYAAYEYSTGIWTVSEVYVEGQDICLDGTNVTINASQAAWLKACGDKATVSNKIENLTFDQFYNDYLLNLDILASENDYTFAVKGIAVGEDTVDVTVTLTRTGALTENEKAKPIVGTLKLKGTASLGTAFTVLGEASVEFDANAKFGDGATETTVTVDTTETDAKFFQPVIE